MAFLAPAVRWPDIFGVNVKASIATIQPRLPAPLSALSPELLQALVVSFSLIAVVTIGTAVLQARSEHNVKARPVASAGRGRRRRANQVPVVLLAGPSGVGKTSLYSALAFKAVPSVHPSQRQSDSTVSIADKVTPTTVRIIDTPGHPRIKDSIISEHIAETDFVVLCIDAKEALRGNAGLSKDSPLIEAVDHLHSILIQLAKSRRVTKTARDPPTLVILFTRADLSPHLANVSLGGASDALPDEGKRLAILANRARTTVETELGRRRAGMGYGARRTTKVGGMAKVTGGDQSASIWASIKSILGLGGRGSAIADDNDDEEDDDAPVDYVDWDTLERLAAKTSSEGQASTTTSLERLDADVVYNGRAICAFASVGKERGWKERGIEGISEIERILAQG